MVRFRLFIVLCLAMVPFCLAAESIETPSHCKYCGMDRIKFAHSRMLVEYGDGTAAGTCSMHCTALELALNPDKAVKNIKVGDYNSKKLIDAETAIWIVGGDKTGVMSGRAKWAFEKMMDAEAFMKNHQGMVATFDDAMKASFGDMYQDITVIRERRKMMKTRHKEH